MNKKNYTLITWLLAVAINGLIVLSFLLPKSGALKAYDFSSLPHLNALLNALTFVSLLIAHDAIRKGRVARHRSFIFFAFFFTSLFLFSYLLYHFSTPSAHYGGPETLKYIYLAILITHVVLAIIIVPLALITMGFALNRKVLQHRRIARWTMPVWLYVSATGVIVYLMIAPYY